MTEPQFLVCFSCRNLERFVQVSDRGDRRNIDAFGTELSLGSFSPVAEDPFSPGIYCRDCGKPVELDSKAMDELELRDLRLELLPVDQFDGRVFAEEIKALVPGSEWTEYEEQPVAPQFGELQAELQPALIDALDRTGRGRLYSHQVQGIESALDRRNVVVATAAGSGKSLIYQVPILSDLLDHASATALVLAPMKALTADQLAQMARFSVGNPWVSGTSLDVKLDVEVEPIHVARYDGGVTEALKIEARRRGDVLFATPDMLHHSVLRMATKTYRSAGRGTRWYRFLSGLRYVVVDEIHVYRGVFGSNVAQVLRRLRRVAEYYGARPRFICCSATIGNPVQLARELTGLEDFELIDRDGSGHGRRIHLMCNPPLESERAARSKKKKTMSADGARMSPQTVILDLLAKGALARQGLPVASIAFGRSRGEVFALGKRLRDRLEVDHRREDLARGVTTYASVLLAEDRAAVEARLRDGSISAIIGTNALELGIDIPHLSFGVLAGYPGQRSVFRQRAGRVGRVGEGVVVTVVGDDPLQQYVFRHPEMVFEGRPEDAVVNAASPPIVEQYGLEPGEQELDGVSLFDSEFWPEDQVKAWVNASPPSSLRFDTNVSRPYHRRLESYEGVYRNIRDIAGGSYTVYAGGKRTPKPIGVIDAASAPRDCFVPAIYPTFDGELYRIYDFDRREQAIYAERVSVAYLTRGVPLDSVEVLAVDPEQVTFGVAQARRGRIRVKRRVYSYKIMHNSGLEESKQVERGWPEVPFETEAMWLDFTPRPGDGSTPAALRGVEHVLLAMAPSVVAVDPFDFESATDERRIYLYDSFAGGMGMSATAFRRLDELLGRALEVVQTCSCENGCPGCVHLSRRPDGNDDVDKVGALSLLLATKELAA